MTGGMLLVAAGSDGLLLGTGVAVLGAGMGFATPGFMSAPTLLATREEQGAVAGLMGSGRALAVLPAGLAAFAFTVTFEPAKEPVAP